jgi:hypothetical protein
MNKSKTSSSSRDVRLCACGCDPYETARVWPLCRSYKQRTSASLSSGGHGGVRGRSTVLRARTECSCQHRIASYIYVVFFLAPLPFPPVFNFCVFLSFLSYIVSYIHSKANLILEFFIQSTYIQSGGFITIHYASLRLTGSKFQCRPARWIAAATSHRPLTSRVRNIHQLTAVIFCRLAPSLLHHSANAGHCSRTAEASCSVAACGCTGCHSVHGEARSTQKGSLCH